MVCSLRSTLSYISSNTLAVQDARSRCRRLPKRVSIARGGNPSSEINHIDSENDLPLHSCWNSMTSTTPKTLLFDALKSPRSAHSQISPRTSRSSRDSDDSLRDLELSEGPLLADAPRAARDRSYSISGFDFQRDLLPLTASLSEPDGVHGEPHEKHIGLLSGIALVVGLQIGSGIFSSPGVVVANTESVGASLMVWLASGLLAWTGASSFAELGSSIPVNGGAQAYLQYSYGPLVAYLFAWTAISALRPGGNAVISLIFAEYLNRLFWHSTSAEVSPDDIPQWATKLTAVAAVLVVSSLCVATPTLGTRTSVVFTTIKIAALISIIVLGLVQLARGHASTSLTEPLFTGSSTSPSSYALALYSGLWAFDGWDQANYVGGEMRNPEKNIPRAIHASVLIVIVLFLLVNVAYFTVLDKTTVGLSNTVALDFGRALFGPVGGIIFALMVAISCFGALNGSAFTSARLIYMAGREGYLPAMFGRHNKTLKTPLNAMCLQAALTITFIAIGGGFRSLINFAVVASWAFYFLTVLGLVILRVKEPMLERPYKTWITTPLIFCAVCLFLLCMPVIAAPLEAMAVLGFVLVGIPVYYITRRNEGAPAARGLSSIFTNCLARVRGRPTPGTGWEAVATEGDEHEMEQTRLATT
ncbi:L-methionine transporter [Amylocystis lapponica]|nr:L-methionine transporter [Amylocystis lapponica]